jgi:hypothetical protein
MLKGRNCKTRKELEATEMLEICLNDDDFDAICNLLNVSIVVMDLMFRTKITRTP